MAIRREKFPTYYSSDLPEALHPGNPRDYGRLLLWIYFQPGQLKHYLYHLDPDLYLERGIAALRQTAGLPATRDLYAMAAVLVVVLSTAITVIASIGQGASIPWAGVVLGATFGVVFAITFGVVLGVLSGMAFGVVAGVTFGVAFGIVLSLVSSILPGAIGGLAVGLVFGLAFEVTFGMAFGGAVGATAGVIMGVAFGMGVGLASALATGVTLGVTMSVPEGLASGLVGGLAGGLGGSRILFHIVEGPLAWFQLWSSRNPFSRLYRHPALWDELAIWPLPGTDRLLRTCLEINLDRGLCLAVRIAANPFQRWAVQRALSTFLQAQPDPLELLYRLCHISILEEYPLPPLSRRQFRDWPTGRILLLGELGQTFVDSTGGQSEASERRVWTFTRRWRYMDLTPLSLFSGVLYELLHNEEGLETATIEAGDPDQLVEYFRATSTGVRPFPHGSEVADSFPVIAYFLGVSTLTALAAAHEQLDWIAALPQPFLRPAVIETLKAVGDISRLVAAFQRATSTGQKSAVLNRAAGELNELTGYVRNRVLPPERVLLKRVVEQWQTIVAGEQGRLGEAALREMTPAARRAAGIVERTSAVWQRPVTPFHNPYIVGKPVYPPLLVGREAVFNRIGEVWSAKDRPDSIVVYGHRRMGKSSILRNLDQVVPPGSVVVYVDMAGETSFVESTGDLLLCLADKIYAEIRRVYPEANLTPPTPETYDSPARAQFQFNRLIEQIHDVLADQRLILALDEFEAVERAVSEGKIGQEIYQYLRSKTQEPWLALVFGGLHTLDEMSRDYQQPFYGSYENIRISYLSHEEAWRLITNPSPDFALNYEAEAVERIISETGGQPYLIQQVCRDVLEYLNHELFDLQLKRDVLIQLADVEWVLGETFFRRSIVYFDGVWSQVTNADQRRLLRTMAEQDDRWMLADLEATTGLDPELLRAHLRWAERHDILRKAELIPPVWEFCVPLMRRWIREVQ